MQRSICPVQGKLGEIVDIYKLAETIWLEHYRAYYSERAIRIGLKRYCAPEEIASQISDGSKYFMLKSGSENAGFLALHPDPSNHILTLSKLYILKQHRGTGLGGDAMRFAETFARDHGCSAIQVQCAMPNVVARRVYERQGFRIIRRFLEDLDGETSEEAILEKTLG